LAISDQAYAVRVVPLGDAAEAWIQFELRKKDGEHYTVTVPFDGVPVCTCGDWVYRREQIDPNGCKHIDSCRAIGLLDLVYRNPEGS
jgi:hypothetical protein